MTWSREDITADILRQKFNVDTTLPYWELRRHYRQARHIRHYLATGGFSHDTTAPPRVNQSSCQKVKKDG